MSSGYLVTHKSRIFLPSVCRQSIRVCTVRHLVFDLDRFSICSQRRGDVENVKGRCDADEQCSFSKMAPRADPVPRKSIANHTCTRKVTHRLPYPKMKAAASRIDKSSWPFRMKRSGRKSPGFSYTVASCIQALCIHSVSEGEALADCLRRPLHHVAGMRVVPAGMK